ncbi:MAG TPA: glycohydrolase toxin TNT-related protein [Pseudonocardiaceae bacterium]
MGIELPTELAGVAATAGVQWPQADEDAMRSTASAWRQAGKSLTGVSADADSSANKALAGTQGATATAAQQHWNGFIEPDSGKLTTTVQGCNAAADQLEHAADQVGEAKVQIVQHLVTLAKNTDAAHQAAATGNPTAMLGLDTAVRGTSANIAKVNANLTNSIRQDGGSTVYGQNSPVNANPGGGTFAGGGHGGGLSGLEPLLGKTGPVAQAGSTVDSLGTGPLATATGHGGPGTQSGYGGQGGYGGQSLLGGGQGGQGLLGGQPGSPGLLSGGHGDPGLLGAPGSVTGSGYPGGVGGGHGVAVPGAVAHGGGEYTAPAGENTGPIQLSPIAQHGGTGATMPDAHTPPMGTVQQSAYVGPSVSPTMQPFAGGAAPAAPIAPVADAGPAAAPAPVGFAPDAGLPPAQVPGGYGAAGSGAAGSGAAGPGWSGNQYGSAPVGGMISRAAPAQYVGGITSNASNAGGGAVVDQPSAGSSHSYSRPAARRSSGPRDPEVAIFLVYMFPIGHLPVAASRPARQLPLPAAETDLAAGSRFEPHDHPDSAVFDTVIRGTAADLADGVPAPAELIADYDPLGGGNEADWDRRFLVRPASDDDAAEFAWPPGQSFPEGGCDHGEAVRLAQGTILDRFGSNEGRVFSVPGTPFAARSLPPDQLTAGYHRYEVLRELPMWWALSTAWFGQPGGGVRYRSIYPAADLVALGFLQEMVVGEEE